LPAGEDLGDLALRLRGQCCDPPLRDAVSLKDAIDGLDVALGGVMKSYPQDADGKKTSASFLYNASGASSSRRASPTSGARASSIP